MISQCHRPTPTHSSRHKEIRNITLMKSPKKGIIPFLMEPNIVDKLQTNKHSCLPGDANNRVSRQESVELCLSNILAVLVLGWDAMGNAHCGYYCILLYKLVNTHAWSEICFPCLVIFRSVPSEFIHCFEH